MAGPIPKPIRCRRSGTRSKSSANGPICGRGRTRSARSPACATASAASIHDFFQEEGFLYIHTPIITASDCEGAGAMFRVTTLDPAKPPRTENGEVDYAQDFFRPAGVSHRARPARRRNLRLGARQDLHVRPDVSRGELQHLAAPGRVLDGRAGDGVLRPDRQHGAGRAFLKRIFSDVLDALRRGHGVLQRAHRQDGRRDAARTSSTATSAGCRYTEAVEILESVRQEVRVSRRVGQRPASRARALPHRRAIQRAGDPLRLPAAIKPFYMRVNDDGKTVRAMDVLVPGSARSSAAASAKSGSTCSKRA